MLISFSVANFRSFRDEQTLSLVANKKLSSHGNHGFPIPGTKEEALRAAVIYGANGAGKSNFFKALRFVKSMATRNRSKSAGTGREPFRFSEQATSPSTFDLQFIADNTVYRYGLKVSDQFVTEEWLVKVTGRREKILFERLTEADGRVVIDAPGFKPTDKVRLLANIGGPHNQTFLATVVATLDHSDFGKDVGAVVDWFSEGLRLIAPNEPIEPIGHMLSTNSDFLAFAGDFLKLSSTGVDHLKVEKTEISEEDLSKMLPKEFMDKLLGDLESADKGLGIVQLGEGIEILVERKDVNHFYRVTIQASHKIDNNRSAQLNLSDESDGTRRLLQLVPALHRAKVDNAVYFVDEIDRSMHPMLIWKFLEAFIHSCCGNGSQIIVTTHESNLLDLDLLRRDEIWFVEKDHALSSQIYSLMDFKIRKDLEVRKHYLQGRFGAVPFLGNIDGLIQKDE